MVCLLTFLWYLLCCIRETAASEVKHLFASADANEDGLLGFDEILDHHEVFVGSEVTDYGEHLHNLDRFQDELWCVYFFIYFFLLLPTRV